MLCSAQMESRASARVLLLAMCSLALVASPLIAAASDEAVALLAFKRSSVEVDPRNSLQSWGEGGSGDPCSWYGVTCSGTDWRVRGLDLRNLGLVGRLRMDDLMSLQGLGDVNLRGNSFYGNLSHAVAAPCAFEVVDLSGNNFSEAVASRFLGSCNNLVSLNLSRNSIPGGIHPFPPSLRTLDLSRNSISDDGLLNYSLAGGCSRGLSYLNMSGNKLSGSLQEGVSAACGDLAVLDLSYNLFSSGEIPRGFMVASLRQLSLSHNNFSGDLYSIFQFGPCGNLTGLDLSHNSLRGSGLPPTLDNCRQLESLDLSHNAFEGAIPAFLGNMRSLKHLSLSNNFSGELTPELSELCGTLVELDLSGNMLTGGLPPACTSCAALQVLHLGDNQLSGDFISTVVRALPKLRFLYLPFNNITGPLPLQSLRNCTSLEVIDLGSNEFTGSIPRGLCSWLPSLQKLLLPSNFLSGALPPELGDCTDLRALDLSFNDLSGPIPPEILSLPNLVDLVMWANKLSGEISDELCSNGVVSLQTLILNHNVITGIIPPSLTRCTNLIWVSLSGNKLSGSIPDDIGNLQNLAILQLGNNTLSGAIPPSLGACRNLIWLDLTLNDLSGPIPSTLASQTGLIAPGAVSGKQFAFLRNEGGSSCAGAGVIFEFAGIRPERLAAFPLVHACPTTRIYTGTAVYTFAGNGSMIYLDLSYNSLSGGIPDNMGAMNYLQVFNLGHNQLTGPIPVTFGGLKAVGVLDLSHNLLTGDIPGSLGTLSFLVDLDVSNNHLSGTIPSAGQLTTFPASRYDNNSAGLCGVPLPPCRASGAGNGLLPNTSKSGDYLRRFLGGSMLIGIAISVLIILALGVTLYRLRKKEEEAAEEIRAAAGYVDSLPTTSGTTSWKFPGVLEPLSINVATFEKPLRKLTFAHLLEATNGFSADSLIGSGGFGEVYKARLKDGCTVAIKKLVHVTGQGDREFTAEMETIGKIKHRNLVPLLGYCKVGEERLLVYEYMKHGSLDMVLHDGRPPSKGGGGLKLDWPARKRIAIGSARGLAFLHHSCIPHIIHRDMKSSNVLLDENLEPRVSDFGMARLMNALDTHLSVSTLAGTPGYVPPEYYQSFRCTTKGDVYSYGVLLLELLSGKRPTDQTEFGDNNNLVGWAKQMVRENRSSEIFDPELTGSSKSGEVELYRYLKIACECLEDRPLRRPTMIQVMAMFKELQTDSDSDILDGLSSLLDTTVINESREKIP